MRKFVGLRGKMCNYLIMALVKIKKQNAQKNVPEKENLSLKITETV